LPPRRAGSGGSPSRQPDPRYFDFTGITHIDSAAIGTVVRCYSKLKTAGGMLRLAGCNGMIDSSLKLTKVDKIIGIFPTASAAAEDFPLPKPNA
jgi:anti-anti-sigma factor